MASLAIIAGVLVALAVFLINWLAYDRRIRQIQSDMWYAMTQERIWDETDGRATPPPTDDDEPGN